MSQVVNDSIMGFPSSCAGKALCISHVDKLLIEDSSSFSWMKEGK